MSLLSLQESRMDGARWGEPTYKDACALPATLRIGARFYCGAAGISALDQLQGLSRRCQSGSMPTAPDRSD